VGTRRGLARSRSVRSPRRPSLRRPASTGPAAK
jgi:hypothetical protein